MNSHSTPRSSWRRFSVLLLIVLSSLAWLTFRSQAAPPPGSPSRDPALLSLLQTASLRLRLARLDTAEAHSFAERQRRGDHPRQIYAEAIDGWMDRRFFERVALGLIPVTHSSSLFFTSLTRARQPDGSWLYYLPHAVPPDASPEEPCAPAARVAVTPWWAGKTRVVVCEHSYRAAHAFDAIGYCAGQPEPVRPVEPRARCGCGPLLLACLPPRDEVPDMAARVMSSMRQEIAVTGGEILARGGSFDELFTTSRTWQDGVAELLYARRDMLAVLAARPFSAEVDAQLHRMLDAVDLAQPGRWVERSGVYQGSGLYVTTPLMGTFLGTSRATLAFLLSHFLCTDFPANHVDSEALLAVTHGRHQGVRFEVYQSPMRQQPACSGCHAPMDYGAGFLVGLRPPLFGSIPTDERVEGRLYVNGGSDLRGSGVGMAALMSLLVKQPEMPRCTVSRMFTYLVGRPPRTTADEVALIRDLVQRFERSGRRLDALARDLLTSAPATEPLGMASDDHVGASQAPHRAASSSSQVPTRTAALLRQHCARCHDGKKRVDLRTPPPAGDLHIWERIRIAVETGRMPPYDDATDRPQVMAPGERQELVSAAAALIADAQHPPTARRRVELSPRDWVYQVREIAAALVPLTEIDAILDRRRELAASARPTWIAVDLCTAMVDADARTDAPPRLPGSASPRLDDAGVARLTGGLLALIRGDTPPDELAAASQRFRRLERSAGSPREATIALCAAELTAPRQSSLPLVGDTGSPR